MATSPEELFEGVDQLNKLVASNHFKSPAEVHEFLGSGETPVHKLHNWTQDVFRNITHHALNEPKNWIGGHVHSSARPSTADGLHVFTSLLREMDKPEHHLWYQTIDERPDLVGHLINHSSERGVPWVGWAEFYHHPEQYLKAAEHNRLIPQTNYKVGLGTVRAWAPKPTKEGQGDVFRKVFLGIGNQYYPDKYFFQNGFRSNEAQHGHILGQEFPAAPNYNHLIFEELNVPGSQVIALSPEIAHQGSRIYPNGYALGYVLDGRSLSHTKNNTHTFSMQPSEFDPTLQVYRHESSRRNEPVNREGLLQFANYVRQLTGWGSEFRRQGGAAFR